MFQRAIRRFAVVALLGASVSTAGVPQAQAAFPGANGRIVFDTANLFFAGSGSSQIYSVRPDGSGLRQLTHVPDGSSAWQPKVSADGSTIVFVLSVDGENDQLWLMDLDGNHQRALTDEPDWNHGGANFAPGGRVVYSRCGSYVPAYNTCHIVSIRRNGGGMRTIVGGLWHPNEAAVSPDGSTLAYVSDKGGYNSRIWLVNMDETNTRTIGPTFGVGTLSWAPDGSRIAFTGDDASGKVYTIAADGSGLDLVAAGSLFPAWSPNGGSLVYQREATRTLLRARTDGTHESTVVSSNTVPGIGFSDWAVAR